MSRTEGLAPVAPALLAALGEACGSVSVRATDRLAKAHDASHYLLVPQAVVVPQDAGEVARVMAASAEHGASLTFRAGGTSLSGQAGAAGVLVDVRRGFRRIEVLDDGRRVRAEPGATVRAVNTRLRRHGTALGPDPASEISCTIGGIVANNSSGMSCGTHANAYRTVESVVLVLASGTVLDTAMPDAADVLREREPEIHAGLLRLRDRVRSDPESVATLRRLHAIKNTMGYGLNSFLDHDEPLAILEHLVVGSEGTLAFVAETTLRTVPIRPFAATALLLFGDLLAAAAVLQELITAGFRTIELMDAAALRVAQRDPAATSELAAFAVESHAALLVEFQEPTEASLADRLERARGLLSRLPLATPVDFTSDPIVRERLWRVRKGLFAAVAGARPPRTTALLEDVAVPVDRLGRTCEQLVALFARYGYEGSVVFGHARDGNIHFLVNECFENDAGVARYEAFTESLVELILAEGGTLKAEHGTGRIMAPYVRRQYGDELYAVMEELKRLLDPGTMLNPGVILTDDPRAHTRHLKVSPEVEAEVDRCVECGYCESVCPSRDLTLTPRERIAVRRELQRASDGGDADLARDLASEYRYEGVETCAVDGMCQTVCPVGIDTGDLVRRLRGEQHGRLSDALWQTASRHWDSVSRLGSAALSVADALPAAVPEAVTAIGRAMVGGEQLPSYTRDLPRGGARRRRHPASEPAAVYFSSCTTTMFAPAGGDGVAASLLRLCAEVGIELTSPERLPSLCCGTPWKSKGFESGYRDMADRVAVALREATYAGRLPVVCDASSCTEGLRMLMAAAQQEDIRVIDAVAFVDEEVVPRLGPVRRIPSVTLHPTCSSVHLGLGEALGRVAAAAADLVVVPDAWGCCGFAGDRGMLHPELTASATRAEAAEVAAAESIAHASLNRTCELGMTRATGSEYRHILQILDEAVRGGSR